MLEPVAFGVLLAAVALAYRAWVVRDPYALDLALTSRNTRFYR